MSENGGLLNYFERMRHYWVSDQGIGSVPRNRKIDQLRLKTHVEIEPHQGTDPYNIYQLSGPGYLQFILGSAYFLDSPRINDDEVWNIDSENETVVGTILARFYFPDRFISIWGCELRQEHPKFAIFDEPESCILFEGFEKYLRDRFQSTECIYVENKPQKEYLNYMKHMGYTEDEVDKYRLCKMLTT